MFYIYLHKCILIGSGRIVPLSTSIFCEECNQAKVCLHSFQKRSTYYESCLTIVIFDWHKQTTRQEIYFFSYMGSRQSKVNCTKHWYLMFSIITPLNEEAMRRKLFLISNMYVTEDNCLFLILCIKLRGTTRSQSHTSDVT